jgi:YegS/Rv2252/BmrU family lipid kinase
MPKAAPRRVLVVMNPAAGRRRGAFCRRVLSELTRLGCLVTVRVTAGPGDAEAMARAAAPAEVDVVAAAGGDGTVNEVANGLVGRGLPLAVIPLGTANVVAAELGLPARAKALARVIAGGPPRPVRLGLANGRRFVQMAGVGFDAHVVAAVTPGLKRVLGKAAYVLRSLTGMARFPFPSYRLLIDGAEHRAASAIVARGHFYGGRFVCAPTARLEEPRFQVCLFERRGAWNVLRYGFGLLTGLLSRFPDVRVLAATEVIVEGPAGEPVQGDGDVLTRLPLTARIDDATLDVVMPG